MILLRFFDIIRKTDHHEKVANYNLIKPTSDMGYHGIGSTKLRYGVGKNSWFGHGTYQNK